MILGSYDNSADARAAIDRVAELMPGANASYAASDQVDAAIRARGRSGIEAFLLAASPTQSSSTPTAVLVVPSPVLAERRRDRLDQHTSAPA